jgi:hypothetical protein
MALIHNAAEFLFDSGLLGEINRVVLHPRGLALGVNHEEERGPDGEVRDRAISFSAISRTDDPGGYDFSAADLAVIRRKLEASGMLDPLPQREADLGCIVQPLPPTETK